MAQKWIIFFQTPFDRVVFKTDALDERASLSYYKFKEYLMTNYFIRDRTAVLELLDKFQTILVDENGDYQVIKPVVDHSEYTFDELFEMNKPEDEETNKSNPLLDRAKGIIEQLWQQKKKPKKNQSKSKR